MTGAFQEDLGQAEQCGAYGGSPTADPYWGFAPTSLAEAIELRIQGVNRAAIASNLNAAAYVGPLGKPRWRADGCRVDIIANEPGDIAENIFRVEGKGACSSPAVPEADLHGATPLVISEFAFMGYVVLP